MMIIINLQILVIIGKLVNLELPSKHSSMQIRLLTTAIFQKSLKRQKRPEFWKQERMHLVIITSMCLLGIRSSDLLPLAGFHPDQASSVWKRFFQHNHIFSTYSTHKTEPIKLSCFVCSFRINKYNNW